MHHEPTEFFLTAETRLLNFTFIQVQMSLLKGETISAAVLWLFLKHLNVIFI